MFSSVISNTKRAAQHPAKAGAVFLSYIGVIAVTAFAAAASHSNSAAVQAEAARANQAMLVTGRRAIISGCIYDNQRSKELRGILQRSAKNQRILIRNGAITREVGLRNLRVTLESFDSISFRDCEKEAAILKNKVPK